MKYVLLLVAFAFSFVSLTISTLTRIENESSFLPLLPCSSRIDIGGVQWLSIFCLTQNVVLASGIGDPELERLYAVDKKAERILYESDPVAEAYGWELYQFQTNSHVIILWEIGTEYSSILDCFIVDINKEQFAHLGEFELALPLSDNLEEDNSYPVDQISILPSDTLVTFRFPQRLLLRPYDDDAQEVDSIMYELNLRTSVMGYTSWVRDTMR